MTNSIAWQKFERASLKAYSKQALSKMFRWSKISWDKLLTISVRTILRKYGITNGTLIVDDKNHDQSKNAEYLHALYKIKDKKTGDYVLGQNIVVIYLVTEKFYIPVSLAFYAPDSVLSACNQENKRLKKQGILKNEWLKKTDRSVGYPKKCEAEQLPEVRINCVLADAFYGNGKFINELKKIWPSVQVIAQIRANQKIRFRQKEISSNNYFKSYQGGTHAVSIRGQKTIDVTAHGVRVTICSQEKKGFLIALKYE